MINIKNEPKPVHAASAAISYKLPGVYTAKFAVFRLLYG